ncbi:MAG TPA: DinB family protein [Candidatus Acidoferrum sp.]|nr:DinB family protein [Candidatus Acidoferrum sp.]
MSRVAHVIVLFVLLGFGFLPRTLAQDDASGGKAKTPSQAVLANWNDIGRKLLDMASDWSEDRYSYRLTPEVRTFQQVLLHVAGSNYDLVNHLSGKHLGDDANDPSVASYKTKEQTIAFLKKSIEDGEAEIKREGDSGIMTHLSGWIGYTEHMGEHYGLLVAYYRANGIVPPESRPRK